jgi:UDP-N-acetylglucosamine acyltransferase
MTGAGTTLLQDLPPYVMATGNPASAHGINTEGLRRRGFTETQIASLRKAYKLVYKSGSTLASALEQLGDPLSTGATSGADAAAIALFSDFLAASARGIVR